MEWMHINELNLENDKVYKIQQIERKQLELETIGINNTPPILINERNQIVDGGKRYLVHIKLGIEYVPTQRMGRTHKVSISKRSNQNILKIAA